MLFNFGVRVNKAAEQHDRFVTDPVEDGSRQLTVQECQPLAKGDRTIFRSLLKMHP